MTNLTSEQYRDVLKHVPECTEEIPSIQVLLRRAVATFFKRFGAYPEAAGVAPGKIGIFGDQTQFSEGLALPAATPMATIVVGRQVPGNRFSVATSADMGKPRKVKFSFSRKRPLGPGCPTWLNYVKGVIDNYSETVPPFEAVIESSVPIGVGFGSSSAVEVATYTFLEVLVGKKSDPIEKAMACQKAEREFAGNDVGLVDRINAILAKDRHAMLIDCQTNEVMWIPFRNPKVCLIAVDSHLKDTVFEEDYPEKTKYLAKAAEMLGVENLRNCTEDDLAELMNRINEILSEQAEKEKQKEEGNEEEQEDMGENSTTQTEIWTKEEYDIMVKRARFFITEMSRITQAVEAWNEGNVESFGEKMKESHISLKEDFDFNNPVLDFLVDTSLQVEGVLGSRMTGMGLGFGGGIVSLVNKENIEKYCRYVTEKFSEYEEKLAEDMKEAKRQEVQKHHQVQKRFHSKHFNPKIASSEKIGQIQDLLEAGGALLEASLLLAAKQYGESSPCTEKKKQPCIVKVEKPKGGCGTWAKFQKDRNKEAFLRKNSLPDETELPLEVESEISGETQSSDVSDVKLNAPTFYIVSPFAGARMMFVTKADLLRSLFAKPLPHPKALVRSALQVFKDTYDRKVEAIGLAPATANLFGEFMEFHLGYIISMALTMYTVTVGGRNDTVCFSFKTTCTSVEEPLEMKYPLPCVRPLEMESRGWVNYVMGAVNEFKGHVPGFDAVINSSIPIQIGLNSCAALQSSVYTFLENLTRTCTIDPFEKVERCNRSEFEFLPTPTELVSQCSSVKFLPTFLSKEGHLLLINCKHYKVSHYFFDDPSYVFLIASCKRHTSDISLETLEERLKQCMDALNILDRNSLLNADLKHLRCLKKRDATDEMIKRTRYIITEHQRTIEAVKAIKDQDYARVGCLMTQSHMSLRDDYEVSSPEIEELIKLALSVEGVLGAKMLGKGLNTSIIILIKISDADKCIRFMRKNYKDKSDKPVFYITKPAQGAFMINPQQEFPLIP